MLNKHLLSEIFALQHRSSYTVYYCMSTTNHYCTKILYETYLVFLIVDKLINNYA